MAYTSLDKFVKHSTKPQGETPSIENSAVPSKVSTPELLNQSLTGDEVIPLPSAPNEKPKVSKPIPYSETPLEQLQRQQPKPEKPKGQTLAPIPHKGTEVKMSIPDKQVSKDWSSKTEKPNMIPVTPKGTHARKGSDLEMEQFLNTTENHGSLLNSDDRYFSGTNYDKDWRMRRNPVLPDSWYVDCICIILTLGALAVVIVNWNVVQSAILSVLLNAMDVVLILVVLVIIVYWIFFRYRRRR